MKPVLALLSALATLTALTAPAHARSAIVRDGAARFTVLTPTLIRAEYAADGRFEDRPTQVAVRGRRATPRFTTAVTGGVRVIRTARMTLRWRRDEGPFTASSLSLTLRPSNATVTPLPGTTPANLGGWTRALDNAAGPVPLHGGVLSRDGWFVLDDSATALLTDAPPGFAVRPARTGAYADWYLFGYGRDYTRGLRDLRTLTGPAPLLPRSAFGVWFSRYFPYSADELRTLVRRFRTEQVPLDTLSIDTDYKAVHDPAGAAVAATAAGTPGRPFSWNAWSWNRERFPDPKAFVDWAHDQGVSVAVNIHPTIDSRDPRYPDTVAKTGPLTPDNGMCRILQADPFGTCMTFDWTKPPHLGAYFGLHDFTDQAGVDLYWLDWCCDGPQPGAAGLTDDTWINAQYAAHARARGTRWPAFSRIGGHFVPGAADDGDSVAVGSGAFAEHRSTIQFTGDTCASWAMLAFQARLTASEGNIGLPYVSHDIGSFNGEPVLGQCGAATGAQSQARIPDDMYARWVQFGTFQPLDRLHSNHGSRLPWERGGAARAAATAALRLREALVPTTYTLARRAHDTGLPITGGLYLSWPEQEDAYRFPSEFTFGPDVVVAPVAAPGDPATSSLWVPPGTWTDLTTGERFTGPARRTLSVPLARIPVLVRGGAVLVTQPAVPTTSAAPPAELIATAYPGGTRGTTRVYDDDGQGFDYERGRFSFTTLTRRGGALTIGPARGPVSAAARRWRVRFAGVDRPARVRVRVGGRTREVRNWTYDADRRTVEVVTGAVPRGASARVTLGG